MVLYIVLAVTRVWSEWAWSKVVGWVWSGYEWMKLLGSLPAECGV